MCVKYVYICLSVCIVKLCFGHLGPIKMSLLLCISWCPNHVANANGIINKFPGYQGVHDVSWTGVIHISVYACVM